MQNIAEETIQVPLKQFQALESKVRELTALVGYYEEQLRLSRHQRFGTSSERTMPGQLSLFAENDNSAAGPEAAAAPELEQITCTRRKKHKTKDRDDFSNLPVEMMMHSLPEEERLCPGCGNLMHVMGHERKRELEIIPAQVKVVEHTREVYSCRNCEKNSTAVPVIKAPMPAPVIKGSPASPSSVAYIMIQKYMNAMPLYRQEQDFLMNGFQLSRQTMVNWLLHVTDDWLEPLYNRLKSCLIQEGVLHTDETVLRVLNDSRKPGAHSYMWLYRTGGSTTTPTVLYEYQPTRAGIHPKTFLQGFTGYLHTDGYDGYHNLPSDITVVGCWAHARRKFDEAIKGAPPQSRSKLFAREGLELCNLLFSLDREYEKLSPEERYAARLERSQPVSDELFAWAESATVLPRSLAGRAIHYLLGQKPWLKNVFLDGRLELSNNRAERSIRPFVIGRKNWLFSITPRGAKAGAIIYSIMETAKENRLRVFEYLKYLFQVMPNVAGVPENLLPWSPALPAWCRL